MTDETGKSQHTPNRLAAETSPYLLQHQFNPVQWYAWGPEAFAAARTQKKPIFLSVGYSTCYWCHVMERQCFERQAVADEMNQRFINIKVDREERPDVDQLYMTAVQLLTRHGGWPMSVFLLPDLRPFYGGTYYPPNDTPGRPGFVTLLRALEDAVRTRPDQVEQTAAQLTDMLRQLAQPAPPGEPITFDGPAIDALIDRSVSDYDPRHGGFGASPKFPRQTLLELLLAYLSQPADNSTEFGSTAAPRANRIDRMLRHTLDALSRGGIRDHLGGGFHRYSTDEKWLIPHFEIMLYDNAMLGWVYVEAYRRFEDRRYSQIARGIFDFVLRELTSPLGAFYTALDAETDTREGDPYLWKREDLDAALTPDEAAIFAKAYGLDLGPNFADPHHGTGEPLQNVLFLPEPIDEATDKRLAPIRAKLLEVRKRRRQPMLDRKILTSWNALMIRALAHGGEVLAEPRYLDAATRAANYLLRYHRTEEGAIRRSSTIQLIARPAVAVAVTELPGPEADITPDRAVVFSVPPEMLVAGDPGTAMVVEPPVSPAEIYVKHRGTLDDYAFLARAMFELYRAAGEDAWRRRAEEIAAQMQRRFGDSRGGLFFTEAGADDLIVRQKIGVDSPLPSGNAVAAQVLLELGNTEAAEAILSAFASSLAAQPEGMSAMLEAAVMFRQRGHPLHVPASSGSAGLTESAAIAPVEAVSLSAHWSDATDLIVHLTIRDGFHINANSSDSRLPLRPTRLSVQDRDDAIITWPPGELATFPFASGSIPIYRGEVLVSIHFDRPLDSPLLINLSFQACDDSACLMP
ncbi:MAG TPA: DUF255 domain-containing protein, partial [Tepidisphaeraceae bacterium]|nr:DUF255 domain-containing protein [Tepidisphaeraceae bacterium]